MPLDHPNGLGPEQVRVIALFDQQFVVPVPVCDAMRLMLEMVDLAHQRTVEMLEPPLPWPERAVPMPKMPLADQRGLVPRLAQQFR